MSKTLNEVFDLTPYIPADPKPVVVIDQPTDDFTKIDNDADMASENIKGLLDVGKTAIQQAASIAEDSEEPRAYEVLANMMKIMADMNSQLLDIHDKKKKIKGVAIPVPQGNTINNTAVFVGTTSEMLKNIKNGNNATD